MKPSLPLPAEIKNGHPGFPADHATTYDLTNTSERFVLRALPGGGWQVVWYRAPATEEIMAKRLNRRRVRFTRWVERRFNR